MASDWLPAALPANQMSGLKTIVANMDFNVDII